MLTFGKAPSVWTPKLGDHVKVVSLAPLERTRKLCARFVASDLRLGDEGVVKTVPFSGDTLFEVHFTRINQIVFCNQEMVQPYSVTTLDLRPCGAVSTAVVYTNNAYTNLHVACDRPSKVLLRLASHEGWRSLSYSDTTHEFPVTEVWREE
jgi:hypothetical protein